MEKEYKQNSGIIIVNKEKGMTSRDVVNKLSKILGTKKVGHTGTLDPLATGVLVCTIGKCTKLSDYLTSTSKKYLASFKLGFETDTLDITGNILKTSDKVISNGEITMAICSFIGTYKQEVPAYSAVKINGKKLYEYARNGENISLPKREVDIKSIKNISFNDDEITFEVLVSKGTYIRSLIRDIGYKLGTYATMTKLSRIEQGEFSIQDSYTLEDIEKGNYKILSPKEVLKDAIIIEVDDFLLKKVINGVKLELDLNHDYILFTDNGQEIALYKKENDKYRMYVMF